MTMSDSVPIIPLIFRLISLVAAGGVAYIGYLTVRALRKYLRS